MSILDHFPARGRRTSLLTICLCEVLSPVVPAQTPCESGMAGIYPCNNIDLLAFMPRASIGGSVLNDIWGWTDPVTGKEYALVGRNNGTAFVDISDPVNPVYTGNLPSHTGTSIWRDIKVYQDHAFIVAEINNHGVQVFDLTQLRGVTNAPATFSNTARYDGIGKAHNIVINEDSGYAYLVGGETFSGGLHFIDISNPTHPVAAGGYAADGYTHDAQCIIYDGPDTEHLGKEICFCANEDTLTIVDVSSKAGPHPQLSREGYPGRAYTHQGWLTEDRVHFLLDDEDDTGNTRTYVWDVSDLDDLVFMGFHEHTTPARDHNLYIVSNHVYEANYESGVRILELSDIANGNLIEVGYLDTYPEAETHNFNGAWSVYPFFESGVIIASSSCEGLFVLQPNVENIIPANLAVEGAASEDPLLSTNRLTYTLTITNEGPNLATGVVLTDVLPVGVQLSVIDQRDDDDDADGFGGGTSNHLAWNAGFSWLELDLPGLAMGSGSFTSRVVDAKQVVSWDRFSWVPLHPYQKELPDGGLVESGYPPTPPAPGAPLPEHPAAAGLGHGLAGTTLLLHFNEDPATNGAVLADVSGFDNHAVLTTQDGGTNKAVSGEFSGAVALDGIDDEMVTGLAGLKVESVLGNTGQAWIKTPTNGTILSQYAAGATNRFALRVSGGVLVYEKEDAALASGSTPIADDQWHHVAFRRTTNGTVTLFADGWPDGSGVDSNDYADLPTRIGALESGVDPFAGALDEIVLSEVTLDDDAIREMFQRARLDLQFQVRACDDPGCLGEDFAGPDGTTNTFFSERMNTAITPPSLPMTHVVSSRYFQYRCTFLSELTNVSPSLVSVHAGPDHYDPEVGSVTSTAGSCGGTETLACNMGLMTNGQVETVTVTVTVSTNTSGLITNTASIVSSAFDTFAGDDSIELVVDIPNHDGDALPDFADPDDDNDMMPDLWESLHGLNRTNAQDAVLDADGDDMLNREEFIADTIPTNGGSVFGLDDITQAPNATVWFDSSTQRVYSLQFTDDLSATAWSNVTGAVQMPGQGPGDSLSDSNDAPARMYRLSVELP